MQKILRVEFTENVDVGNRFFDKGQRFIARRSFNGNHLVVLHKDWNGNMWIPISSYESFLERDNISGYPIKVVGHMYAARRDMNNVPRFGEEEISEDKRRVLAFMEKLRELEEEHGVGISDGSCGCCGYTHIYDKKTGQALTKYYGSGFRDDEEFDE